MKKKDYLQLLVMMMVALLSVGFVSCKEDDEKIDDNRGKDEIIKDLMSHKWTGSSTDYDVYSYGGAIYTETWVVYFTSENEGVMHVLIEDKDSSLGTSKSEEHLDFTYVVDGTKVRLSGGSNFVFDYYGNYMMEGDDIFTSSALTSSDQTYLQEHKNGYHGTDGPIDTEVFVIDDNEILMAVFNNKDTNGWYLYRMQFGFGANGDDAYKKGITKMRLTYWADNGCVDGSYKTYNYGKKRTETLNLSLTNKEWYSWIHVTSLDSKITFNYELEYYNSKNGQWYDITSKKLTFNAK